MAKMQSNIKTVDEIIGYIGGLPVIKRDDCEPGVLYCLKDTWFKQFKKQNAQMSQLPKRGQN